ncbi:hypothetical protein OEZ86_008204 [Tetradesmus obliquus]|nr:hypothetical protein OEZ86_008204 [Tetradesmus obliquus]
MHNNKGCQGAHVQRPIARTPICQRITLTAAGDSVLLVPYQQLQWCYAELSLQCIHSIWETAKCGAIIVCFSLVHLSQEAANLQAICWCREQALRNIISVSSIC